MEETRGSKKIITIMISILVLMVIGLSVAVYFLYAKGDHAEVKTKEAVTAPAHENELGTLQELDEVLINLQAGSGKKSILKMKVNLELTKLADGAEGAIFTQYKPVIFDVFYTVVSQRSKDELSSVGGKEDLKEALKEELNRVLPNKLVKNIYWKVFVIQ